MQQDRVGLGWRPELAAGIFDSLDRIDILEVIADNYVEADRAQRQGLAMMARDVPIHLHSIDLGLAGSDEVATARLDRIARLVDDIKPEAWSDHLAFTRSGDIEIGHLAAPPRTSASVDATVRNVRKAAQIVGSVPFMENIATLIDPPGSTLSEAAWIAGIMSGSGCGLLLDLHNLYANATNFGFDPLVFLDEISLDRVDGIHIAGGKWITSPDGAKSYLLDDHLHPVDQPVFDLLTEVAARTAQPLTVILERDGAYPPMPELLAELDRAREAMCVGRSRRATQQAALAAAS